MTRWKLTVEYDGSGFYGWQRQPDMPTVQQALEEAIYKFSQEQVTLHVAGRTDTGVHARANVAHADLEKLTDAGQVRDALNFHLRPHKVSVVQAEEVDGGFHARFSALGRSYRYTIINRQAPPALDGNRMWHVARLLDREMMQTAANKLIGQHDFSTFRAQHCQANSPVKTLDRLEIKRDGDNVIFEVAARSFLYHQVRNMVGTLVMVGSGQWNLVRFEQAFAACDRKAGGPTAPPQGLIFWAVSYSP